MPRETERNRDIFCIGLTVVLCRKFQDFPGFHFSGFHFDSQSHAIRYPRASTKPSDACAWHVCAPRLLVRPLFQDARSPLEDTDGLASVNDAHFGGVERAIEAHDEVSQSCCEELRRRLFMKACCGARRRPRWPCAPLGRHIIALVGRPRWPCAPLWRHGIVVEANAALQPNSGLQEISRSSKICSSTLLVCMRMCISVLA